MIITPAVFPESFEQLVHKLFLLEGLCERVQIDICDGVFGLEKTWMPYREKELPHGFLYEFDLMVHDWRKYLPRVIALGADRVILHIDYFTAQDLDEAIALVKEHKVFLGLSVSNDYDIYDFEKRVRFAETQYSKVFIQLMGIRKIGAQGQPFDDEVLARIQYLHDTLRRCEIQVDGSMNNETMLKVLNRGASCAVVGSYLMKRGSTARDVRKVYEKLEHNFG